MCRSRRELSNAYLLAKFGVDTVEDEPSKVCPPTSGGRRACSLLPAAGTLRSCSALIGTRMAEGAGDGAAGAEGAGDGAEGAAAAEAEGSGEGAKGETGTEQRQKPVQITAREPEFWQIF